MEGMVHMSHLVVGMSPLTFLMPLEAHIPPLMLGELSRVARSSGGSASSEGALLACSLAALAFHRFVPHASLPLSWVLSDVGPSLGWRAGCCARGCTCPASRSLLGPTSPLP
jgi:hypothetical protein